MANVKIQGNASGSGVLTITAPNTDATRTITLPDATGTLLAGDGSISSLIGYRALDRIVEYADVKTSGTHGGTLTSGAWRTRNLAEIIDTNNLGTIGSSVIVLVAGTYYCTGWSIGKQSDAHQCRLYNTSDSAIVLQGTCNNSASSQDAGNLSILSGEFVIAGSKNLELQHRCETTKATTGFGDANSFGDTEVYARIQFRRIG
jgi:hypothetical protein